MSLPAWITAAASSGIGSGLLATVLTKRLSKPEAESVAVSTLNLALEGVSARLQTVEGDVKDLRIDLAQERRHVAVAVAFIRKLLAWIDQNTPGTSPPAIPDELKGEVI